MFNLTNLASCGTDVYISDLAVIRRPKLVKLGSSIAIDEFVLISTALETGDFCHIAPHISIIGGPHGLLKMGHFTTIAAGSRIICGSDGHTGEGLVGPTIPEPYKDKLKIEPVTFENFASVGTNVIVMPGVILREGSVVGANSLVTKDTEPWTIYFGSPARPIKMRESFIMKEYARKLGYNV